MGSESEAEQALLNNNVECSHHRRDTQKGQTRAWAHWIVHAISLSLLLIVAVTRTKSCPADVSVPRIVDGLPREAWSLHPVRFNGSIDFRSEWKGSPRPELEAAWNSVTYDVQEFPISRDDLRKNGREDYTGTTVKFPTHVGDGYMAGLEVFHHLHCLNMLRKVSYKEYYEDHDILWTDPPEVFRDHVDHCIDMLRQTLMCSSDVGLTTHVWVKGYSRAYPDYSTVHQCRDFDGIRNWVLDRQLSTNVRSVSKPLGAAELENPPFP